jgi:hypothetical protein
MCDRPATSREHVPAACFFPEKKDLLDGVDLRRNLFTVPSCDEHNGHKSEDDQYLWQIITATRDLNERGQQIVRTKVIRSVKERPALVNAIMRTAEPAKIYSQETGEWHDTVRIRFDAERLSTALEHFARALHFQHFKRKWDGVVATFPSFSLFDSESSADRSFRQTWRRIIENSAQAMASMERIGQNQEVFYYQVLPPDGSPGVVMRATFYGRATVTIGFLRPGERNERETAKTP